MRTLASVQPNGWNPNVVPPHVQKSIEHGFRKDGWLASHALLVWGRDEKGAERNLIIDGEHRWKAGTAVGMAEGPMVFLEGLTEAQAKALTIKMDQKRGRFDEDKLGDLLRSIQGDAADLEKFALDLGFEEEPLMKLLAEEEQPLRTRDGGGGANGSSGGAAGGPAEASIVRMVQLFLDVETHPKFAAAAERLAAKLGTKTLTDTVYKVVIDADSPAQEPRAEGRGAPAQVAPGA